MTKPRDEDEEFRTYGPYFTMLNDITYGNYHIARGESRLLPGFRPAAGDSFHDSGSVPTPSNVTPARK